MKKAVKFVVFLTLIALINIPIVNGEDLESSGNITKYFKTIEHSNTHTARTYGTTNAQNNSEVYELTREEYYAEVNSYRQTIVPMALISKSDTTTYKTLTVSYEPTSGGKYRVRAKVDWDVIPLYRRIDHLGTTHMASSSSTLKSGTMTYVQSGVTYTSTQNNPVLSYNEYLYIGGQIVDHDLPNSTNVTDIKFETSYEVNSNPGSDLCAVIYHQDTSEDAPNYLARYFYGNADIRMGGYDMSALYSIQYVCFP